eukprot:s718_g5.t1
MSQKPNQEVNAMGRCSCTPKRSSGRLCIRSKGKDRLNGLHELLVSKLADHATPQGHRGLVARCLLDAYRAGASPAAGPANPDLLGRAMAASAAEAQAQQLASLETVAAGAEEALRRHQLVSMLEESLSQAYDSASMLGVQADTWRGCLRQAKVAADVAETGRQSAGEDAAAAVIVALSTFSSQLEDACARLSSDIGGDGGTGGPEALRWELQHREAELIAEPLLGEGPGDVARAQADLEALGEERMSLARRLAEQNEACWNKGSSTLDAGALHIEPLQLQCELEASKSALARDASAAMRSAESQRLREALQEEIRMGQDKAQILDDQLRYATEALSARAAAAESAQNRPTQPLPQLCEGLQVWLSVNQAQKDCEEQLLKASRALRSAASELKQERRCRQQLRGVIRDLAMRLQARFCKLPIALLSEMSGNAVALCSFRTTTSEWRTRMKLQREAAESIKRCSVRLHRKSQLQARATATALPPAAREPLGSGFPSLPASLAALAGFRVLCQRPGPHSKTSPVARRSAGLTGGPPPDSESSGFVNKAIFGDGW